MEYNCKVQYRLSKDMKRALERISKELSLKESEVVRLAISKLIREYDVNG